MARFVGFQTSGQPGGSTLLDRLIAAISAAFRSLDGVVTNDRLMNATIGTGDTKVYHGLGAPVRAWEVVDRGSNAVVWQSSTVNTAPNTYIILRASTAVAVKLRFS